MMREVIMNFVIAANSVEIAAPSALSAMQYKHDKAKFASYCQTGASD